MKQTLFATLLFTFSAITFAQEEVEDRTYYYEELAALSASYEANSTIVEVQSVDSDFENMIILHVFPEKGEGDNFSVITY